MKPETRKICEMNIIESFAYSIYRHKLQDLIINATVDECNYALHTLTPLHLAIIIDSKDLIVLLLKKGVVLTKFNKNLFEWMSLYALRLKVIIPDKVSKEESVLIQLWNYVMDWMKPEYSSIGLQETYSPWELSNQLEREYRDELLIKEVSITDSDTDILEEEREIKSAFDHLIYKVGDEEDLYGDIMNLDYSVEEKEALVEYAEYKKKDVNDVINEFNKIMISNHSRLRLELVAQELRDEIYCKEYLFNTYEEYLEKLTLIKNHLRHPLPEFCKLESEVIIFPSIILGKGTEGFVVRGRCCSKSVAVKFISMSSSTEIEFYRKIYPDRNIIYSPKVLYDGNYYSTITMPCYEVGSLYDFIQFIGKKEINHFTTRLRIQMITEIAVHLANIHNHKIAHRDIKSKNILLQPELSPIFIDFGFANKSESYCGTIEYMAPEIILSTSTEIDFYKSDVYSFAILFWEIFTCKQPWSSGDEYVEDLFVKIEDTDSEEEISEKLETRRLGEFILSQQVIGGSRPSVDKFPNGIKKLLDACWNKDPMKRPTMNKIVEILNKLLA